MTTRPERRAARTCATRLALAFILLSSILVSLTVFGQSEVSVVRVSYTPGTPANVFVPSHALGAGVDGHEKGSLDLMLRPANVREMQSAGFKPLSYRLRTELGAEAWHWNPRGRWSDPVHRQGYWTSDVTSTEPIHLCYGYFLPRRGSTTDQANDEGYSRLDDGDTKTFWKSNPYLDQHFTGEKNELHPQWVVIDLGETREVNALRILWATPYALQYDVQYAPSSESDGFIPRDNAWQAFPQGSVKDGKGGEVLLRFSGRPVAARYLRILMFKGSRTAPAGSREIRDRLGYAIRELYAGVDDESGNLRDAIRHAADHKAQTVMWASSTDPWHRAVDRDDKTEQPGFDWLFRTGLTNGQPMLLPVALLYDTPENAVAEIKYMIRRGYPVQRVEMGEEPEGQLMPPEDYALLYMQWATALHKANPKLQLGGPCFSSLEPHDANDPDLLDEVNWTRRFLGALRDHGRLKDYNFFSFEWYPFDDVCDPPAPQLAKNSGKLENGIAGIRKVLPKGTPLLITEYGYSAYASEAGVSIEGGLLNADSIGTFLTLGGEQTYQYGLEPNEIIQENACTWGNNTLFTMDERGRITHRLAAYWAARVLTGLWAKPSNERLEVYPAHSNILDDERQELVTAYAIRRPDGGWSLMLINKDPKQTHSIKINFEAGNAPVFKGAVDLYRFSPAQYVWHPAKEKGYPDPSNPPAHSLVPDGTGAFTLPAYSLSVVRDVGR